MTRAEALTLSEGSYVTYRGDVPLVDGALPKRRVTAIWTNDDRTIIRARIAQLWGNTWIALGEGEGVEVWRPKARATP